VGKCNHFTSLITRSTSATKHYTTDTCVATPAKKLCYLTISTSRSPLRPRSSRNAATASSHIDVSPTSSTFRFANPASGDRSLTCACLRRRHSGRKPSGFSASATPPPYSSGRCFTARFSNLGLPAGAESHHTRLTSQSLARNRASTSPVRLLRVLDRSTPRCRSIAPPSVEREPA